MEISGWVKLIKFGLVGFSGMTIDFSITYFLKEKIRINKYWANACGFTCAVISNFYLNAYWTFTGYVKKVPEQLFSFSIIAISGLVINSLLIFLLIRRMELNFYLSKLAAIFVVFVWNFLMNNYFTFSPSSS